MFQAAMLQKEDCYDANLENETSYIINNTLFENWDAFSKINLLHQAENSK